MKRLEISDPKITEIALKNEILQSKEARYNHKLHGLLLICRGYTSYDVAEVFGQNATTMQRWVKSFEKSGFSALEDGNRTGRPQRLEPSQLNKIDAVLRKSTRDLGYEQNLWDGQLLAHFIKQTFKIDLGSRQCQRLFHQLGFRLRKPRPVIGQANPMKKEAFKKTL